MSKRFQGKNSRARYKLEYRENRVFESYIDSDYDFGGDQARLNAYRSWVMLQVENGTSQTNPLNRRINVQHT